VLERRQIALEARVEELAEDTTASCKQIDTRFNQVNACVGELSRDMTASFKQLVEYHIQQENQIDTRFNQVDVRFDKVEKDIAEIKATMATKEDIATIKNNMAVMENRILDAFQQLIVQVSQQRPPSE